METVCNALFGRYFDRFLSFVEHKIKIFKDCPDEFTLMRENVVEILKLMEDVENADHGMKSPEHLTNQVRELMYEAEDRVEDYSHDLSMVSRFRVGIKLEDINEKLKEMKSKLENSVNAILEGGGKRKREDDDKRRLSLPVNDVTKIVGLEDAISKIKEWILNKDQQIRKVKYNYIGLVGKGGSGKTTLAQMILKDKDIKEYFQLKMLFVTVSQPLDVKMMMKSMLKQLNQKTRDDDDVRDMSSKIFESLKGSRYFLILDDVWNLDGVWWETIKNALPEGSQNCVLVTSRMRNIVRDMGFLDDQIHEPEALGEEDGWTLFCKNISTDDVSKDTTLKEIGMEIVKQCCGLPLAIKVMGAVVSSYRISPSTWMEIRDNFKQHIFKNENNSVMGSLGLSYDDLRGTYLQQCLLCFGVFPEDHVIQKDTMIRWWIGEGFVPLTEDGRVSVESAEICFEELVNRSLVEVVIRDYTGKVLTCKVHDLVREMLIQKGKSEAFFEIGKDKISRRIYLDDDISIASNRISVSNTKVRAIVKTSGHVFTEELLHKKFNECKYLRVITLISELKHKSTFESIGNLKHLKYLEVSEHIRDHLNLDSQTPKYIPTFTKSILVLCLGIHSMSTLPDSITELKQLIWLDVSCCTGVRYLPKGLENVSTLQVLKGFKLSSPPSTTKGSSSTKKVLKCFKPSSVEWCRFEELRKLTQLVTLEMMQISDEEFSDSELNALSELDGLRHLTIHFDQFVQTSVNLDKLVLPKHLDEVKLKFYPGEKTPSWLNTEDLPRLRCLSFSGGRMRSFHDKFYQGKNWGIAHLELDYLRNLRGDWNLVLERLPYLETLYCFSRLRSRSFALNDIRLENFPSLDEFDNEGVWRNPKKRA